MITTKKELQEYLEADGEVYGHRWFDFLPFALTESQVLYRHIRYLRAAEYADARRSPFRRLYLIRLMHYQVKFGVFVPLHVVGKGFLIQHLGSIIINPDAQLGEFCKVHPGVCIGANHGKAPKIGDRVYIGPGAKVFGDIRIADDVQIGANAVVTHSCKKKGAHLLGNAAREV